MARPTTRPNRAKTGAPAGYEVVFGLALHQTADLCLGFTVAPVEGSDSSNSADSLFPTFYFFRFSRIWASEVPKSLKNLVSGSKKLGKNNLEINGERLFQPRSRCVEGAPGRYGHCRGRLFPDPRPTGPDIVVLACFRAGRHGSPRAVQATLRCSRAAHAVSGPYLGPPERLGV